MKKLIFALVASAVVGAPAHAVLINQLINGSFEAGFTGWTVGGTSDDGYPPVVITYGNTQTYPLGAFGESIPADNATSPSTDPVGNSAVYFVADQANPQTLTQSNVSFIAGQTYTFGFDIYVPFNGAANANNASFAATISNLTFATFTASSLMPGIWTHIESSVVAANTGTGNFVFAYSSFGIPAKDFVVDRVFFGTESAVPEPASWAMMVGGFGLLGAAMRRRRTNFNYA